MHEPLDFPTPTLTERLRAAAVARAEARGDVVDGVVLDDDGVIDLRVSEPPPPRGAGTATPTALRDTRGAADDVDVSSLYESEDEPAPKWWQRRGGATVPPPLEDPVIVPSSVAPSVGAVPPASVVDDGPDVDRPTASCPVCESTGRRDLWDRVGGTDYFSCDECHAMWQVPHR